ncbi:MAG: heme NO-binding domain-containing protein [Nitrospirae bacterium]|nr:heme NO-binding domain-containing protein [Nitrospirota bacterium]MBI4838340.1 heme NO-binding domain-containing protein [Nitrospirota bacterium]
MGTEMHGIIFLELQKYVVGMLGNDAWNQLMNKAGVKQKIYLCSEVYPDQEILALVAALSKSTGESAPALLEDFGKFIVPALFKMYRVLIKPEWKTLDVIEHAEETIHKVVRIKNPGALPPALKCTRTGPGEIVINYKSPRRLCSLAKGIAQGLAAHFNERISINEKTCMLKNADSCSISIKLEKH